MNATSIESCPPCEEKQRSASSTELYSQGRGVGRNGGSGMRDLTTAAPERHQSEEAQRFLLEISAEFVSRDHETTLKRLAVRAVPFFADFCFFDVLSVDGIIQRVCGAHANPVKQALFDRVDEFVPTLSAIGHAVSRVLRTGKPDYVPDVTDAWVRAAATSQRHFELMRDLEVCSMIAVPLLVPGLTLGVLTFCYSKSSGRRYRPEDLRLAEDLAHRAALVVENARLYHALEVASRRKDEFLAMLGHELRNPLAALRNGMEIFRLKGTADLEVQEATAMVERQIQQLTRLVDDLFDVSRVGHGKINLQMMPIDLNDVVALAIEVSRPLIDARKHVLKVSLPRLPVEVEGDPGRLAQVVSNLLNNSAKYSEDRGRIELTVEAIGDQAVLRVRDAGIGIEPAMLPRIFDLFSQAKSSASRFGEGLGIGLALVRNMIELHGGCVQAASAGLGLGTEFVIRLPLLRKTPASCPAAHDTPCSTVSAPTRRILIVDDNRDSADSMAILLRLAGHAVSIAYDGQTALTLARLELPEVVLCDISMPDMCGLELARRLRQDPAMKDALLVALSGYAQEEDRHRSQEAGFNAHLAKPASLDSLKALLASEDFQTAGWPGANKSLISAP
jgi:signal transduction histidine kinase/ActR/RegA family two-component response regulator